MLLQTTAKRLHLKPDNVDAWQGLGVSYGVLGKYDDAIAAYREAIKLYPNLPDVWFWLGEAYAETGKQTEALDALDHLRKIDPSPLDPSHVASLANSLFNLLSALAARSQPNTGVAPIKPNPD